MIPLGEAIYEHGTLRLLQPADLREQQHVLVTIRDVATADEDDPRPWRGSRVLLIMASNDPARGLRGRAPRCR